MGTIIKTSELFSRLELILNKKFPVIAESFNGRSRILECLLDACNRESVDELFLLLDDDDRIQIFDKSDHNKPAWKLIKSFPTGIFKLVLSDRVETIFCEVKESGKQKRTSKKKL